MKVISTSGQYKLLYDDGSVVDEVERFIFFLSTCGKSPNTQRTYAYNLKLFYDFMISRKIDIKGLFDDKGNKPIDVLCSFIFWLQYPNAASNKFEFHGEKCKRSNRTVNAIMSSVLSFYQYLSSNNEINELSVYKIQRSCIQYKSFLYEMMHHKTESLTSILKKPVIATPVKAITRDQYIELLKHCNSNRDKLLLALLFEGGLRLGEALGIHFEDLDQLQDGIVKIIPRENNENSARVKEYAGGIIKLPDYVVNLILNYLTEIDEFDSDFLFITLRGKNKGIPLKPDTVEKKLQCLSNIVGYKVTPHMLRHGFATEKLEAGWQMIDIQAYLRHKSISSTQIYASYSDELKKEKIRDFLQSNNDIMRQTANELGNK